MREDIAAMNYIPAREIKEKTKLCHMQNWKHDNKFKNYIEEFKENIEEMS